MESVKPAPASFITVAEIATEFAHHDPNAAKLNNGSLGGCPKSVLAAQSQWQLQFLTRAEDFFYGKLQCSILDSRTLIKELINAGDVDEVSLVDNTSTAAAIVLQKVAWDFVEGRFSKGDAVVVFRCAFGAIKKSVQAYVVRAGGRVVEANLPFPMPSNEEIIVEFKRALQKAKSDGKKVRLAIIDHITSMPSIIVPVKELVKICKQDGVDYVFIDGAHAIGTVEIDVASIGADFYASSLHKWFFAPPSVSFLYCKKSVASSNMHHPIVSHLYGNSLPIESSWTGTRDYSAQLAVPSILKFVERFEDGINGIRQRNHEKVVEMGKMLAASWGTRLGSTEEMCCSMIMVGLPRSLGVESEKDARKLRGVLREEFRVEVPIYYHEGEGSEGVGYVRISHQVYNVEGDYVKLRDAIDKLVEDVHV